MTSGATGSVLLDLNIPLVEGFTAMRKLKAQAGMRRIPVVVITTIADSQDVQRCNQLGRDFVVTKPTNQAQFAKAMRELAGALENLLAGDRKSTTHDLVFELRSQTGA